MQWNEKWIYAVDVHAVESVLNAMMEANKQSLMKTNN